MKRNNLDTTDIMLSPVGLGTVKFGRNESVKYPKSFELPSENDLAGLLALAKDFGINTIDTAPAYGQSEERLGRLLKGQRQEWVIIDKAGEEFENGISRYDFTPSHFEKSLHRSLKRLNTDYLDIFLIHSDGNDLDNLSDELIQTMRDFKKRGLVRAIGASTKTVSGGIRALDLMDTAMVSYNPDYLEEKPVLDHAQSIGKSVILKKVLSSGHSHAPSEALQFGLAHPAVASAIIGTINPDNLRNNVSAATNL